MENHKNIKYKKKYNKYKNKYYKLTKNKIYGGTEWVTITTIISIILLLAGLGYYVFDKDDSISKKIKNWFDQSDTRIKKQIQNLKKKEELEEIKTQTAKKVLKMAEEEEKKLTDSALQNNPELRGTKKDEEEDEEGDEEEEKKKNVKKKKQNEAKTGSTESAVNIGSQNSLLFKKEYINELGIKTYYDELEHLFKTYDISSINENIIKEIRNYYVVSDPITQKKELHWDFNTRHFYWTPNNDPNNKTVLIKYYPRFGDPNDISVYELKNFGKFEEFNPDIKILLPEKKPESQPADPTTGPTAKTGSTSLTDQDQMNMNQEKIASMKENQNNLDLLKKEGKTIIEDIISDEKQSEAINKLMQIKSADIYLQTLSKIILEYTSEEQKQENLTIAKIPGDGWCQFHSIIHQLLQNKKLLELLIENYEKQDYRNFIKDSLRKNIIKFINELKNIQDYDKLNSQQKDNLVVDLLNIMITFVKENGDFTIYECNNADGNLGQSINFVEKIWMELFIKGDQNNFTVDKFDYGLIKDAFIQYYTYSNDTPEKHWGGDSTLILIQFIFNLEINLYTDPTLKSFDKKNKLVLNLDECEEEDPSLIEINLLYTGNNHYDSVIKKTQS